MNWADLNFDGNDDKSRLSWSNRYKYVISQINDLQYMLSKGYFKKVGSIYVGRCVFPHHNDKTASLAIYPPETQVNGKPQGKASFFCFGCQASGSVIQYTKFYYGLDSNREACKFLEKEFEINVDDTEIQNQILKETLKDISKESFQTMSLQMINLICNKMCKNYLNWVRENYKSQLKNEFNAITAYYKNYDEEILDLTVNQTVIMIDKTSDMINKRKQHLIQNFTQKKD